MRLLELTCRNFRCLAEFRIEPGPGINVIRGRNAQGKTSILEAALYAATSRSHRTSLESDLTAKGAEGFSIRARAKTSDRHVDIEAYYHRGAKRFKVNGAAQTRLSDILGKLSVVLFTPEDIALVKGAAAVRRTFLDMELSQLSPRYLHALQEYRHTLRQRNEALRVPKHDPALVEVWNGRLALHGETLISERNAYVEEASAAASRAYAQIADDEQLSVAYRPDVAPGERFEEVLALSLDSDVRRGTTQHGPHRDDLELLVAGEKARSRASQGQQKSAALALKLGHVNVIHARTGEFPVLMLDEVLSELDDQRARRLFDAIDMRVQCLVTTTDVENRKGVFRDTDRYYTIEQGRLLP